MTLTKTKCTLHYKKNIYTPIFGKDKLKTADKIFESRQCKSIFWTNIKTSRHITRPNLLTAHFAPQRITTPKPPHSQSPDNGKDTIYAYPNHSTNFRHNLRSSRLLTTTSQRLRPYTAINLLRVCVALYHLIGRTDGQATVKEFSLRFFGLKESSSRYGLV